MNIDIFNTDKKYKTIYADPPWMERGCGKIKRGADRHYNLMTTKEICKLPVKNLIHPEGCHLYLCTTNNFLKDAFEVIDSWGFEYITTITWMKDKQGLGQYFRGITEHHVHLDAVDDNSWMEITKETLEECFDFLEVK